MNLHILTPEVQRYLREHEADSPADVALLKSPFAAVTSQELAQQLDARQRCQKKLPHWYDTPAIYYPEKISIEQASSEATANYKAGLISSGQRVLDATGGMGVDTFFFASIAKAVVHCETTETLSRVAQHNAAQLHADNIGFVVSDGMTYLQDQPIDTFDCVYIDPSRRVGERKVFRLEDCEPNVVASQGRVLQRAKKNIIKCAPLLDVTAALERLHEVCEIHIVSVERECKELLFVRSRGFEGVPVFIIAALKGTSKAILSFDVTREKTAIAQFGNPERYLYEPDAALLKSGAFKFIAEHYGVRKLHAHTHLYTSSQPVAGFIGKTYRVDKVVPYRDFKKTKLAIQAAVSTRNFPLKAEALRQRHGIRNGGDTHLFFCTGMDAQLLVIFASKYENLIAS